MKPSRAEAVALLPPLRYDGVMTYTISTRGRMGAVSVGARDACEAVAKALTMMAGGSTIVITDENDREIEFSDIEAQCAKDRGNA